MHNLHAATGSWVRRVLDQTNELRTHAHWPGFWHCTDSLLRSVEGVIRSVRGSGRPASLRAYEGFAQRYDLPQRLVETTFPDNMTLETWLPAVFGRERYCLSMNGLSKWSEGLHLTLVSELVLPLVEVLGRPRRGSDFYTFLGNYELTPFGIHNDDDHTFLIHLGPRPKHVFVWPKPTFIERTGSDDSAFSLQPLRPFAAEYLMNPGDFLFIPEGDFHVLGGDGFSATLGMSLFPATSRTMVADGVDALLRAVELDDRTYVRGPREAADVVGRLSLHGPDLASWLVKAIDEQVDLLRSNGFVTTRPARRRPGPIPVDGSVRIHVQCPIILASEGDGLMKLFVRGYSITVKSNAGISRVLSLIHDGTGARVRDVLAILSADWEDEASVAFLALLRELNGITFDQIS